jgi:cellulose 1,4-beta-cellobiosidase
MWIVGLAVTLLAACGGGGGGGSSGPGSAPGMTSGVSVKAGNAEATITWDSVAGATSYNIYRSATQGQQGTKIGASSSTSYVDTTAVNGATYYYQVTADNTAGEGPVSTQSPAATPVIPDTVPSAPTGLSATPGNAQVALDWTAVTGAKSYNVYRSTNTGAQGAKLGTSLTTTYSDTSVLNGTTYYYQVTAANTAGEGTPSVQSTGATPNVPVTVPTTPTGVNVVAGNAQVTVSWTAAAGATSYNIYRATTPGAQGS